MEKKSTFLQLKETEREYRRELILDAAMKLFSERPFSEIGMRNIAKEAGISPASIYRYYPSRDAILMEVLGHDIQEGEEKQKKRLEEGTASIEEIATGIVDFFLDKDSTLHLLSHFMLKEDVDPETMDRFLESRDYYLNHFDRIMIDSGAAPANVRLFSHAFFASLLGLIMAFRNYEGKSEEEDRRHLHRLARLTATIFKNGIPG